MPRNINFAIRGEYITLDALLKAVGAADSGAQAKHRIEAIHSLAVDGKALVVHIHGVNAQRGADDAPFIA